MQNELRGPRLGRRYFGKDLTNIEEPQGFQGVEAQAGKKSGAQASMLKQANYRPLTSHAANKSPNPYLQAPERTREYQSYVPVPDNSREEDVSKHGRYYGLRKLQDTPRRHRGSLQPAWESCENEEMFENPRQPPRAQERSFSPTPMLTEAFEQGYPQHPAILRETDSVFMFGRQMNFPGSDFLDYNGIPFANIWSHLIFKRVGTS